MTRRYRPADAAPVIVVGFDGSTPAEHAVAYAAGLARRTRGTLIVAYILATAARGGLAGLAPLGAEMTEDWRSDPDEGIQKVAEDILAGTGTSWDFVTARGEAAAALEHLADERRADVVVVGRSRVPARHVLGSVPARLARHAHCPITVVP